jgi:TM2 domain-containing membrane protein YozV
MNYFLLINGERRGPFGEDEIREMLDQRLIPTVTLTLEENSIDKWVLNDLRALVGRAKAPAPVAKTYYIVEEDKTKGPYTIGQLRGMWNIGNITGKTMHRQEGYSDWHPLSSILDQLEPPPAEPPQPQRATVTKAGMLVVTPRKSRGLYIILGLFGPLGIHNFYAGYYMRGALQLIITILVVLAIIGDAIPLIWALIPIIWALIDMFLITEDADGDKMT